MYKIAAKWVQHHLNEVQHCARNEVCHINLEQFYPEEEKSMLNQIQ
jgi:hypothetical protein